MEVLIIIIIIAALISWLSGGGTNYNSDSNMPSVFETRIKERIENFDGKDVKIIDIQGRGLIPLSTNQNINFITSIIDSTDDLDESGPVLSSIETFQEPTSRAWYHKIEGGSFEALTGFPDWTSLGLFVPELLITAYSGRRDLEAILRIVNSTSPPSIVQGFHNSNDGLIHLNSVKYVHNSKHVGYLESQENRNKARLLAVRMAVGIAMADGELDDQEGITINKWIKKRLEYSSASKKDERKEEFNNTLQQAYADAEQGSLSIESMCQELNEIAEEPEKAETLELLYSVMAADSIADDSELKLLKTISDNLDLDISAMNDIRDRSLVKVKKGSGSGTDLKELLEIDPSWSKEEIKKHLTKLFSKWNGRLTSIKDGDERDNVQRMLDLIAKARDELT
jgi:tellurite resistance protein